MYRAKEKRLKKDAYRRRWTDLDSSSSLDAQLVLYPDAAWLGSGPMSANGILCTGAAGGPSPGGKGLVGARQSMDDSLELELDRADDDDDDDDAELSLSDCESVSPIATATPGSPSKSGPAAVCSQPADLIGMCKSESSILRPVYCTNTLNMLIDV